MHVRVFLAGRVAVEIDGVVLDEARFPGRQGRLVFAHLVTDLGRPVPRDELAETLWGETPPTTWDKALTVLVSKLRGMLADCGLDGPSVLTSAFGCYRLDLPGESWIDVVAAADAIREAETALAGGELADAKRAARLAESLVKGHFLPGEYGAWVEQKRRELVDTRARALNVMAEASLRSDDANEAAKWAEQAITVEPFRESGYRWLMQAHAAAGNRAEALRAYERCRQLLREELGTDPSSETESIFRALLETPGAQDAGPTRVTAVRPAAVSSPRSLPSPRSAPSQPSSPPSPPRARRKAALLAVGGLLLAAGATVATVELSASSSTSAMLRTLASGRCSALRYEGAGSPQLLIAADLPRQPGVLELSTPMADAITLELERHNYVAGQYRVGLQVCDDSTPSGNPFFDENTCTANAHQYVTDVSVIGVIGPLTSGCAELEIPILNRAAGGPVPIVGTATTYVGLTRQTNGDPTEPGVYYPTKRRNYVHVLPDDDVQAAADAIAARRLGVKRVYTLDEGEAMSGLFVTDFTRAANRLGVAVVGQASWDPLQSSYAALISAIASTRADGVFLAVNSVAQSVRLLQELRARLGHSVQFMAPDVFDPSAAILAGPAAEGMTISQLCPPNDTLTGDGKQFVASFSKKFGAEPTPYAVAAAQATDVLLDAIAHSDGSRASVTRNLFATTVSNGVLGSFSFTPTGDPTLNAVSFDRISAGKAKPYTTVVVPDALIGPY